MKSLLRYSLLIVTFLSLSLFSMAQLTVDVTVDKHVSCPGGDDGKLTIVVSNGTAEPMSVLVWNTTIGVYDFIPIVGPSATINLPDDGALPVKSGSFIVFVSGPSANKTADPFEVFAPDDLTFSTTQPTCAVPTGTIQINTPIDSKGGLYIFRYSIDGGATYQASPLFAGLSAGSNDISVEISSHTLCFLTETDIVINSAPTPPVIPEATLTQPTCAVAMGAIEVTLPLGANYQYSNDFEATWQDGTTFSNLVPDTYLVTARSKIDNTCKSNKIFTINAQPTLPAAPAINITQPSCGGPAKGLIDVTSPLGVEYEYSIDGTTYQSSASFSDVAPGNYSVTVRLVASPSCVSLPTPATITAPSGAPELVIPSLITHPTTPASSDGEIAVTLLPATGTSPFTYFLTDNLGTPVANSGSIPATSHTFSGLSEGNYTVYVTDNSSCTSASETGIILKAPVSCTDAVISLTSGSDNQTVCQDESITAIVYTITGDFTSASVSGLPTGVTGLLTGTTYTISGAPTAAGPFNYTVTVVGSGTCSGDVANGTILVNVPTIPLFGQLGPYCLGDAAGTLPTSSTNGITGSWNPATVSTAIAGTTTYNFTPTTGQCATTASMSITVNSAPANVNAGPDVTICKGESTQLKGSADLPSNNNVLLSENFSGVASGSLPAGWTRNSSYWGSMNSSYSGGSAPEMALLTDGSDDIQQYRVITPLVDATSDQFLDLSFTHALDHFNGLYTIAVETSPDGVSWTNRWLFEWPGSLGGDIAPETLNVDLSTLDGQSFYIAFTYSGKMFNINYWTFDNIELTGLQSDPVSVLWTPFTGLSDPTILSPIATPSSTTTYTLTVGIGGCENSDQVTVTVNDIVTPSFSLNPTYNYCIGDSPVVLPLVSDNGISGTWNPSEVNTDVSGPTTYTFTPNPGECATSTSIDVQVFDLPSAIMSGGGEYCEGANPTGVNVQIDFTGQAPWVYSFDVDGDVRTFTSNVNQRIFEDVGEGHFILLSVQDANCTGTVTGEAFVVEIPAPTATISGGGDYCAGTSPTGVDVTIEFTGTSPWRFVYAINGVNQPAVTNVNTSPYTISNANVGTYTLITTSDASCNGTVSGTATVTELVAPTGTISGGGDYCAGTTPTGVDVSIALTGNGPWDIVYAINGANQAAITGIATSPYIITNATAGAYTLTSVDDINGCNGTVSGTATVTELVAPTATISGGGDYCAGTTPTGVDVSIALTGNGPWDIVYAIDGFDQAAITGIAASPYILNNASAGTYTLTSVSDLSCNGTVSGTATVTELITPTATISGGGDYCAGTTPTGVDVSIALTGNGPWDIVYAIDGANQTAITEILVSPYVISNATAGEYTLTSVDDTNGCNGTVSGTATVTELVAPTATISGGGDYCAGTTPTGVDVSIALTGNGPWDIVYAIDGANQAAITGILLSSYVISNAIEGEYTLISVDDSNGCNGTVSGTATVTELVAPTATISGGGDYCAGTTPTGVDVSIALTGNGPWDIVYAIDGFDQAAITGIAASPYILNNASAGTYTLTSVSDLSCNGTVSGTATVTELITPTATISGGGNYCAGTIPTGVDVSVALTGNGPWDIVYAIDGVNQAAITGILTSPYVISNAIEGEYTLISVDDTNGCVGTVSGTATIIELELPTATMSGGGAYCEGANPTGIDVQIDFTGVGPWTYSFAVDGDVRTFTSNVNQRIFEDVGEGHFILLSVHDANCTGTVMGEAFVVELPLPSATISGGGDYCAGTSPTGVSVSIDLVGNGPWNIVYAIDGTDQVAITGVLTSPYIITDATLGVYTLTSIDDINGCVGTVGGSATVTELVAPTATISGGGDYCAGTTPTGVDVSIALTGNGPWDIVYAIDGANQAAITGILLSPYVISNAIEGEYTLISVDDINGCNGTVSGTATVTELVAPTATISGGGDYCAGTTPTGVDVSIALTGNGPWDIVYAIDGFDQAAITGIAASPYILNNASAGTYTLTSVSDLSCNGTVSGTATVTELITPTATISGGGDYCAGTTPTGVDVSIALTGNGPWNIVHAIDGTDQVAITGVLTSPYIITDATLGVYTLTSIDDINGCVGTVGGSATVTELVAPTATISGGGDYCAGTTPTGVDVSIALTGNGPWDIVYAIDGANQAAITGILLSPYVISNAIEGEYTLISVDDINGCNGTVSGTATVTELVAPTATISGGGDYCAGTTPTGVDVSIALTGNGPWDIVYAIDGFDQAAITGIAASPYILNNASAGTYTLTSVSDLSCNGTVSGTATVTELITPTATISGGGNYCAGTMPTGVDVSVALTGNGPWDIVYAIDGANQVVITAIISSPYVISNAIEGEYTLISVDDSNGCVGTVSGTATVIELELPTATMSGGGAYCIGANPTGVDVQIDFIGVAPWTYSFAVNGDVRTFISTVNQRIFEDAGEGHFTLLSVHDANCTGTVSGEAFVVEIETAAPTGDANQEFCAGATIADINVTGEGIAWYDAPNGNMLNMTDILVDGVTYYATQTAQGCESLGYLAVTVSVWNELTISIIEIKHGRCDIPNAGSIEVQGVGSVFNYTYTLFDEFNNQIGLPIVSSNADPVLFTGLAPGKYYVSFDDLSPCAAKTTALVEILEAVPVTIDDVLITNSNCFGNNNAKIEVTASGGGANLYFSLLDNLETVVIGPQTNDGVIVGVADGDYIILVESDNGCEARLAIEVKGPDELSVQAEIINIPCSNSGDIGIIRALAVGGTAPYSVSLYLNGVLEDQVTGVGYNTWVEFDQLPVGSNYEVVVDDRWGCGPVSSGALEITLPSALVIGAPVVQDVLCHGGTSGQVTITASGGTFPYAYTLFDNNDNVVTTSTNGVFGNVASGTNYYISVVDVNGCGPEVSSVFDVNEPDPIVIDINSILIKNIVCNGATDGEVSLSASGGTGDLYYTLTKDDIAIAGPQLGNGAFTGLSSGVYIIEVTDDRNCGPILSNVINVDEPEQLTTLVIKNNPLCNGDIGSISISTSKGIAPYTYELFTGVTVLETALAVANEEVVFNNLTSGVYFVKITDANGCTLITDNYTILDAPEKLLLTLSSTDPISNDDGITNGTITAIVSGGTTPYRYFLFKSGETVSIDDNNSGIFSITERIAYQVRVVDANGCEVVGDIVLTQYIFTLSATNVSCYGQCDGTITVNEIDGSSTLDQRKWLNSNGEDVSAEMNGKYDVAEGLYKGICAGTYKLRVEINGEVQTDEIVISEPDPMVITSLDIYPLNCFGINKGEISIWAEGNTLALEYRIEGPLDSEYEHTNNSGIFTNLAAGSYKVFITDGNGCTQAFPEDGEYEITQPDEIVITTVTDISLRRCHDDTIGVDGDGIIEMKIEGGTGDLGEPGDYTYSWNKTEGDSIFLNYPIPGIYELTVTDKNQCVAVKDVVIPGPEPIIITFEYDTADCRVVDVGIGNVNGGINISAITGGNAESAGDFSLKWYRGTNDEHLTDFDNKLHLKGRQANEFYAVVTDLEGCIDKTDFAIPVDENNLFDVLITKDNNYCYRDQAYLTALVETPNLISIDSYRWVNVTDNPDIENKRVSNVYTTGELLHSTLFRVDAVSKKGCIESAEATLSVYPRIGPFIDRETHPFFVDSDLDAFRIKPEDGESYGDSTIISLLADTEYPIEIFTENADYTLSYSWTPVIGFNPSDEKQTVMIFRTGEYQSLLTGSITNETTKKVEQYIPIVVMAKSEYECIEEVSLKARILDKIKNSNVFSPNGDGINDRWTIPYSDVIPNLEIKIYNRWGALIWSAKGAEASKGWDGKNSRGKDLSIGTYYYVISFNVVGTNKWKPISGSVTIIR